MMGGLPSLAVKRPLLASVLNLLIVIAGLAAVFGVEVRELPDVDRPIVTVRAVLPGAAPETMDAEVTSILEGAAARVQGVKTIRSSSEENNARIRVEFRPGTNLDVAANDIREAVAQVQRQLPARVEELGVTKADDDADPIVQMAVLAPTLNEEELTRIIDNDIVPEFLAIDGVASVGQFGAREKQLRVVIDPLRLSRYGLTVGDVANALQSAPFDVPVGSFLSEDQAFLVRAEATAATPERIKAIVLRDQVTVGDVAEAFFSPADATAFVRLNGQRVIGLSVVRQAQSNTIDISDAVGRVVERLNRRFDNVEIVVNTDDAVFIRASVREVITSLLITIGVVMATIFAFFGSGRATLIPSLAIPVALVGTLAGIYLLGFSVNIITLLALVLATGLIVDDAIVVLENIQRRRSEGAERRAAAVLGTGQVFFAVVATTAVLVSVFVPISFLPSESGRLFREFGFTLALAVIISSFVALTLVPALASRMGTGRDSLWPSVAKFGSSVQGGYDRALKFCLDRPIVPVGLSLAAAAGAAFVYTVLPSELTPPEDRSQMFVFARGPDGVGLDYMDRQTDQIEEAFQPYIDDGTLKGLYTIVGRYDPNISYLTIPMADWSERELSQQDVINAVRPELSQIPGVRASPFGRGSLQVGWGGSRQGLQVALTGGDYQRIFLSARALSDAVEADSQILLNPEISYQPTQPQVAVKVDRQRAADLQVSLDELSVTLRTMVGGEEIIDLNVNDQAIPIVLRAQVGSVADPSDLQNLFIRTEGGSLVPLSSLTQIVEEGVAAELDRTEQRRAIEFEADIAEGYTIDEAIAELGRLAESTITDDIDILLQGEAASLDESSRDILLTYAFAFVIVFLVLVAQFESLTSAVVVILSVPFALAAAILSLSLTGTSLNLYSQIGLVMLIGLMAKNGILMVEFADQLRSAGRSVREATAEAASTRLRPIVMTLISTVLGALPLILSSGAGAEARQSIGWVVFGGLGIAGIFTLFLTPVIYLGIARFGASRSADEDALERELQEAGAL
ncbi:efflux RND transporter permease subunit [Parvularcula sp. ZS-1/3]|uniref:Efflux RND transporter permease subunit n=1 Tax=Parvularcula mediterranea TaxID=2732508 RepID=A0A7Y3RIP9_9PROT|nr:efflux RND transporter permease subunit [Parvularcula mediterranea]NNU14731.1 efflux RND transporter permease subunit [Parvularcula mediterranea]